MVELLVLGALGFAAVVVFAVLASVFSVVMSLVFLPFRILGWLVKGIGVMLALPFMAIFGMVAVIALGAGALMFLLPFLPFALLALGVWWLMRRSRQSTASVAH